MLQQIHAGGQVFVIPVRNNNPTIRLKIFRGKEFLFLNIPVSEQETADFTAEYPLPFPAEETILEADDSLLQHLSWKNTCSQTPESDSIHPEYHFSPAHGWLNDPNGLYYQNGEWHLYFQHNPLAAVWGNMHWGHAVSHDLIHWKEQKLALYPDSIGTMYSGSAIIDRNDSAGFGKDRLLFFYTNAGYDGKGTQCLAIDDGEKLVKYSGNPIIPNTNGQVERDPVPVFDPDHGIWRLVTYLGEEENKKFAIYSSHDLIHWTRTNTYTILPGRECPGLRKMKDSADGSETWLFTEASNYYRLGTISADGKVTMHTESSRFLFGNAYAGQFFHNAPDGRSIFIAWLGMPGGSFKSWSGCMTLPMEIRLENSKLKCRPAVEVPFKPLVSDKRLAIRGKNSEIVFDPQDGTITNHAGKVWQVQSPGEPFSGKIIQDRCCLEYFDEAERYAAAFYFQE